MVISDRPLDEGEFRRRIAVGDDSPPLMSRVPEPPPSHWGKLTGRGRTASWQYLEFLARSKRREKKK